MPDGGMIEVQLQQDKDNLNIRFIDQGPGIPEDILSKLGEAFFTTKEVGTGLGLMVSKEIIANHHGQFIIKSLVNIGTTVEIILPQNKNLE